MQHEISVTKAGGLLQQFPFVWTCCCGATGRASHRPTALADAEAHIDYRESLGDGVDYDSIV